MIRPVSPPDVRPASVRMANALAALRAVTPPPELVARVLRALPEDPGERGPQRARARLALFGAVLALLSELLPIGVVFAQSAEPEEPGAESSDAASEPTTPSLADPASEPSSQATEPPPVPAPSEAAEEAAAADASAEPVARVTSGDDVRLEASLTGGVRVVAPNAAGFTFEAHFAAWGRFELDVPPGGATQDYFAVPLARPVLQASAFDGLFRLLFQPEIAGPSPRLLDLTLDFVPDPAFAVRVGQFRTPFSRAFINPIVQLSMPDRGIVSDSFRADRDTGLMVYGRPGPFEYDVGVFNGSGIDGRIGDTPAPMVVARVALTPYGAVPYDQTPSLTAPDVSGFSIGLGGYFREVDVAQGSDPEQDQQTASGGVDFHLVHGAVSITGEGFFRERRTAGGAWGTSWGAYVQGGVFVVPQILELSARGGWIDPDVEAAGDLVQTYEGAVSGYFFLDDVAYGQHLKLSLRYLFGDTASDYGSLRAGNTHRVTAQLQVWL